MDMFYLFVLQRAAIGIMDVDARFIALIGIWMQIRHTSYRHVSNRGNILRKFGKKYVDFSLGK